MVLKRPFNLVELIYVEHVRVLKQNQEPDLVNVEHVEVQAFKQ